MSPPLASCLCFAFILWLFSRNRRRGAAVSAGLWIPILWVIIISSRPVGYWLSDSQGEAEVNSYLDGSPIDRNVFLGLLLWGLFVLMRRRVDWGIVFGKNRWLWLFYLYLVISTIWSGDPYVAFKRWIKEFGNVVMILIILTERDPAQAIREVFLRSAFVLIPVSVILSKYYLETGRYYNPWTGAPNICGATSDKNALGRLALVSALVLLWSFVTLENQPGWFRKVKEGLPELILLGLCIWILQIAGSATSVGCSIVAGVAFFGSRLGWVKKNPRLLAWGLSIFVVVSVLFLALPGLRKVVTGSLGRNPNLTERTDIWQGAMNLKTNPVIGAGFASVWMTAGGIRLKEELQMAHSHNGYLETYLNSGLIGIALLFAVLFCAGRGAIREMAAGSRLGSLYVAIFVTALIYNYTEVAYNNNSIVGFIMLLIATQYPVEGGVPAPQAPPAADPHAAFQNQWAGQGV